MEPSTDPGLRATDPAPRSFEDLPRDPELGVPVPFACGTVTAVLDRPLSVREVDRRRVAQCALSRICGICGAGLGRPIALLGTRREVDRNAFSFPPTHLACARALVAAYPESATGLLGHDEPVASWVLVTTAGFEYVRPGRNEVDQQPTFRPNSLLSGPRPPAP